MPLITIIYWLTNITDTVSIIIGCSLQPIPLDANGIIRFFSLLAMVEERLHNILENYTAINCDIKWQLNTQYRSWRVTMWHFGRDSLQQYAGEKFSITVENAQDILTRVYSKDFGILTRVRDEIQEYPRRTVAHAMEQKLICNFEH